MGYRTSIKLRAGELKRIDSINVDKSNTHYIQIYGTSMEVKATLQDSEPMVSLGTVTGPGIYLLNAPVDSLELTASNNTTVILCGE